MKLIKKRTPEYYALRYGLVDFKKDLEMLQFWARKADNETKHKLKEIKKLLHETTKRNSRRD